MHKRIIRRYRRLKRDRRLSSATKAQLRYAFVGAGSHSLEVLLPCLDALRLPIHTFASHSGSTAAALASRYPGASSTDDFESILTDDSIAAVFIVARPEAHFDLARRALAAGKHVFVEKPPCRNLAELEELIAVATGQRRLCAVGLQRRYCPAYQHLARELDQSRSSAATSYSLRWHTGPYPDGDPLLELFVHPLDVVTWLFGASRVAHVRRSGPLENGTLQVALEHTSRESGLLELSTAHSWRSPCEELVTTTGDSHYRLGYPDLLTRERRTRTVAGIPLEKVRDRPRSIEFLYEASTFLPSGPNNTLVTQGFFDQLESFVAAVEAAPSTDAIDGRTDLPANTCSADRLLDTYRLLESLTALL